MNLRMSEWTVFSLIIIEKSTSNLSFQGQYIPPILFCNGLKSKEELSNKITTIVHSD